MSSRLGWITDAGDHEVSTERLGFLAQICAEVGDHAWRSNRARWASARTASFCRAGGWVAAPMGKGGLVHLSKYSW